MQRYRSGYNENDSKSFDGWSRPWVRIPPAAPWRTPRALAALGVFYIIFEQFSCQTIPCRIIVHDPSMGSLRSMDVWGNLPYLTKNSSLLGISPIIKQALDILWQWGCSFAMGWILLNTQKKADEKWLKWCGKFQISFSKGCETVAEHFNTKALRSFFAR